jgi:hypothetical protein
MGAGRDGMGIQEDGAIGVSQRGGQLGSQLMEGVHLDTGQGPRPDPSSRTLTGRIVASEVVPVADDQDRARAHVPLRPASP